MPRSYWRDSRLQCEFRKRFLWTREPGGQILQQLLRQRMKFPVRLDIALQENRDILFATAVFGVAAIS
jgi:hypothetical protein